MSEVAAASPIAALPMAGEPARGQRNGVPDCDEGGLNLAAFVAKHAARSLDPSNPAAANPAAAAATASAAAASLAGGVFCDQRASGSAAVSLRCTGT